MFFSINNESFVKNADCLKEFCTFYDLLIYLLNNSIRMLTSTEDQITFFKAITALKKIILSMKADITDQSEEEK